MTCLLIMVEMVDLTGLANTQYCGFGLGSSADLRKRIIDSHSSGMNLPFYEQPQILRSSL